MQGIKHFIPTDLKVDYLNTLLEVGFSVLDCGSFVSAKAIPQMQDTAEVISQLNRSATELLVIVANSRGAEDAVKFDRIKYLGFPLSISETFQQRNTNKSIEEAFNSLSQIQQIAEAANKQVVCYISMGFGNPYNDPYSPALVKDFTKKIEALGINIVSIADTIGSADVGAIREIYENTASAFTNLEVGVHLHSRLADVEEKTKAAVRAGCTRIDGALLGFGGCPMAKDDLVGNMATELAVKALEEEGFHLNIKRDKLNLALQKAEALFSKYKGA